MQEPKPMNYAAAFFRIGAEIAQAECRCEDPPRCIQCPRCQLVEKFSELRDQARKFLQGRPVVNQSAQHAPDVDGRGYV